MSERKTAEIKFRCTPTLKAGVQAAADAAGQSLTEYVEEALWAKQNVTVRHIPTLVSGSVPSGTESTVIPIVVKRQWQTTAADTTKDVAAESGLREFISTSVQESQPLTREVLDKALAAGCSRNCRPWEFCACKAGE